MTQAGLNKITLFENIGISINYDSFSIATNGDTIELDILPTLNIEPELSLIQYRISAQKNDISNDDILKLNNSVYGWVAKFEFLDLSTKLIIEPFFREKVEAINSNVSNSRIINLISWSKQALIVFS